MNKKGKDRYEITLVFGLEALSKFKLIEKVRGDMDKKGVIALLGIIIVIIAGYFIVTYISFVQVQKFGGFPIPKDAEVTKEEENIIVYNWSKASEENGIPKRYQIELEKEGWDIEWREGAATVYKKDGIKVLLICSTNYLSISPTE
ncbi:hypothetical protein GH741_12765 [Aquibacillus halophilus]|uniref:Uncharacterized protein n=1 Tax=Aquibacillus halophilus TaxID=930132 RepID=A0A6A8DQQ1_9BACI|nr:hypothetical protein [Aquibacillus halophilus]